MTKDNTIKAKIVKKADQCEFNLTFKTAPELFSYKQIDAGTQLVI